MPGAWSGSGWQATLQVGGAERSGLGDERAGVVHLAPGVPQEHSPYPPRLQVVDDALTERGLPVGDGFEARVELPDRKSTRLNSSHSQISYAVFCLKTTDTVLY